MADEQTDPLVTFLDKSGLSVAQKRGLWDLYTAAKDTTDLQKRLDALQLPNAVKHGLWNLKADELDPPEPIAAPKVSDFVPYATDEEGRRIDKTGKVVEPGFLDKLVAVGRGENPVATLAIDLLPLAIPGVARASRAGVGEAGAMVREAPPLVKGGVTYAALKGLNHATGMLPEPLPTIGSVLAAGYGSTPAVAEAVAERSPMGFLRPSEPMESSLDLTRRLRLEHQARTGQTKLPAPMEAVITPQATEKAVEVAATAPKLTVQEAQAMVKSAKKEAVGAAESLFKILVKRANPSDAEMTEVLTQFRKMSFKKQLEAINSVKSTLQSRGL